MREIISVNPLAIRPFGSHQMDKEVSKQTFMACWFPLSPIGAHVTPFHHG